MQIVIPMSGAGSRFQAKGYPDIKPLIKVDGKPIIEYVIKLFPGETNFTFICNEDHLATTPLRATLEQLMPTGKIVPIAAHKKGPVWAVLQAMDHLDLTEPTIVNYCDFNAIWDYAAFKHDVLANNYAGAIPCYKGFHPHLLGPNLYASCKVDDNINLLEIREKYSWTENKMDSYQSMGTYYFDSGTTIKKYFQQLVDEDINLKGEYYVSLVYNLLVRDQLPVHIYEVAQFCQWGTPEDLEEFVDWLNYYKIKQLTPRINQALERNSPTDIATLQYWKLYYQHYYGTTSRQQA
jgi:NDP-sugar pyrophosphorylase family protein